ncbi:MAG: nucleoside hydrolase [Chromatiales bacterium]|nr:nucleoside hydrolase [Chromatiales bacterium]
MGITASPSFPRLDAERMRHRLTPPLGPVRVLIDTDAANEIDDQFAIAWALLSQDRLAVEAVTAAPFSFAHHRQGLLAAEAQIDAKARGDALDEQLAGGFQGWIERLHRTGRRAADLEFCGPDEGMERSYQEILRVFDMVGVARGGRVVRGATSYLTDLDAPRPSPATEAIVDLAKSGDAPLYVVAIGCITNVAAALLRAPEIVRDIVVVWTSAYPSSAPHCNRPSMNLVQDPLASRLVFDCGVPHVYLPGYHVGAQLRISKPEMEAFVRGRSAIGDYLYGLYANNPLHEMFAIEDAGRRTWVIWDIINIAWLLNPDWVPTFLTPSPVLTEALFWRHATDRHLMREAYDVQRDDIFINLYDRIARAPCELPLA